MRSARLVTALAAALALTGPSTAWATEPELRHARRDLAVTGLAVATALGLELAKSELAPKTCRICGRNGLDDAVRRRLLWSNVDRARRASDLVAYGAVPAAAAGYVLLAARNGVGMREGWWDVLYLAEAGAIASSLTSIVKVAAGRQRPFVAHGNWPEADRKPQPDDNLAFWSGHTVFPFAFATAAGTIASMRGRAEAPWIWTVGIVGATTAGYLRIAGDKHYLTDVLAGAAVGTAIGIGVPRLLHGRRDPEGGPALMLVPLPLGLAGTF